MDKDVIDTIIAKKPALKGMRGKLEAMQPGAYCMHRSWGFGKIASYDAAEGKLIIDFEEKPGHPMDPAFCADKLEILDESNVLVRQRTEPEAVEELIKKRPADLVAEILSHMSNLSASPTELENLLARLIGPTKFKKWWTGAKKALVKDPRIATPSRKTDPYVLRDEPLKPEQEILEDFYMVKQPKKKIALAEKLYLISENVDEIAADLPNIFEHLTEAVKDAMSLSDAERIHGVWVRNDLARTLHEDPELIEPTSRSLILGASNINVLAANIPNGYHKRFLDLLTRVYPEDWKTVLLDLLKNSEGKMTSETISFLVDRDCEELVAEHFKRWLSEQNLKGPVLYWVVKNRNSRKFAKLVDGLVGPRMLNAILHAIDNEALLSTGNRRITLADVLSDDQELIPDMLEDADDEMARDLAQGLILNQGFEDLTKKSLLARFIKRFPNIQKLVSGEAEEKVDELVVSQKSLDNRKAEYKLLVDVKIPENKEAISVAREHGDLRENAEYKMARQDQETLMARKAILEKDFSRVRITDFSDVTADAVGIGSVVEIVSSDTGEAQTYALLGAWDSAPEKNILSYKTPLGQALMGKKAGDSVQTDIDGQVQHWDLKKITRWTDSRQSL